MDAFEKMKIEDATKRMYEEIRNMRPNKFDPPWDNLNRKIQDCFRAMARVTMNNYETFPDIYMATSTMYETFTSMRQSPLYMDAPWGELMEKYKQGFELLTKTVLRL